LVDLPRGGGAGVTVELRHEEDALAIAALHRLTDAPFALPPVVIPAIVEEGDPPVDRAVDEAHRFTGVAGRAQVVAPEPDAAHLHAGATERSTGDVTLPGARRRRDRGPGAQAQCRRTPPNRAQESTAGL